MNLTFLQTWSPSELGTSCDLRLSVWSEVYQPNIVPGVSSLHAMVQVVDRMAREAREDEESQEDEGGQGVMRTVVWPVRHVTTGLRVWDPGTSVTPQYSFSQTSDASDSLVCELIMQSGINGEHNEKQISSGLYWFCEWQWMKNNTIIKLLQQHHQQSHC